MKYLLGFDVGSSSVKAGLLDADSGSAVSVASVPSTEMEIMSPRPGWAEQDPQVWWRNLVAAGRRVMLESRASASEIIGIGISYQMHGLVAVDKQLNVVRPSIIWCDSRAVEIGDRAFSQLGEEFCFKHLLNSPGNFTASKLRWVKENEPVLFSRIHSILLPGDFVALKLTGRVTTTASGLSEGTMWDFSRQDVADSLLEHYQIPKELIPERVPTFGLQGTLTRAAADELGLAEGTPVCYRAGDQPNNAFSLNAVRPGEVASTAGTSGVIYAITGKPIADRQSRVNTFLHVNHSREQLRYGVLLCVNGTGIMNSWLRQNIVGAESSYDAMNDLAAQAPPGSNGLVVLPFGNGAERMLGNRQLGASIDGLDLNRHRRPHLCRAVQEGIVFALGYGFETLRQLGIETQVIRAGNANMFQSDVFCQTFADVTGAELQLFNVDGALGAARGAGVGAGYYASMEDAFRLVKQLRSFSPGSKISREVDVAFRRWKEVLKKQLP